MGVFGLFGLFWFCGFFFFKVNMSDLFAIEEVKSRPGGVQRFGSQRKSRRGKGFAQTACEKENKANFFSTYFYTL